MPRQNSSCMQTQNSKIRRQKSIHPGAAAAATATVATVATATVEAATGPA